MADRMPLRESNPRLYARIVALRAQKATDAEAREIAYLSQYVREHLMTDHPDNAIHLRGTVAEMVANLEALSERMLVEDAHKLKAGTLVFDPQHWDDQEQYRTWVAQVEDYSAKHSL